MAVSGERPTEMVVAGLAEHGHGYVGQWVALAGGEVMASGMEREAVAETARGAGQRVVLVRVGERELGPGEVWR